MKLKRKLPSVLVWSLILSAQVGYSEDAEVPDDVICPEVQKVKSSETSLDDDFSDFKKGRFFIPPSPRINRFMGYSSKKDLFKDFGDHIKGGGDDGLSDVTLCDGEVGDDLDAAIKITFDCSDGSVVHSCYADVVDGEYALDIPSEVGGLSCNITVEAIEVSDNEDDVEVDAVETEEEIVLSDDAVIEINVEE